MELIPWDQAHTCPHWKRWIRSILLTDDSQKTQAPKPSIWHFLVSGSGAAFSVQMQHEGCYPTADRLDTKAQTSACTLPREETRSTQYTFLHHQIILTRYAAWFHWYYPIWILLNSFFKILCMMQSALQNSYRVEQVIKNRFKVKNQSSFCWKT